MAADSPVWLLQFEWCGAIYRYATRDVSVTDSTGRTLTFLAGLQDLTLGRSIKDITKSTAKLRISTWLDWAAIAKSALVPLDGHYAELRRMRPGENQTPWDHIPLWAAGPISGAQFGERGAPLDLNVPRGAWGITKPVLPPTAVITEETFPDVDYGYNETSIPDASESKRWPLVLGRAMQVPVYVATMEQVAAISSSNRVVICYGEVAADQVRFRCPKRATNKVKDVLYDRDALGQVYSYIEVTDGGVEIMRAASDPMYVDYDQDGGGAVSPWMRRDVRTAGDAISYLTQRFPRATWDLSRMAAERRVLDQILIDTYITDDTDALDWIETELTPFIPGVWAHSGHGVYYQPMDYTAPRHLARWEIRSARDGGQATRLEDPKLDTGEVRNELVLHFGRQLERAETPWKMINPATGEEVEVEEPPEWRYTARLSPRGEAYMIKSDRVQPSRELRVSQEVWGEQPWEGTCYAVEQWSSAWAILRLMAAKHALPKMRVSYEGPSAWEDLQVGDVVIVYDSEIDVNGRVGLIEDVWVGNTRPNIDVVLLDEVA